MNYEDSNTSGELSQEKRSQETREQKQPKKKGSKFLKTVWAIFTFISIAVNGLFLLIIIGLIALFVSGKKSFYQEKVIMEGPKQNKIATINIKGVINNELSQAVYQQLKYAKKDPSVKGVIIKINSPGGGVSASDRIYQNIMKYRQDTNEPVIAFQQGLAASGGYYSSVACEKIYSEPTTITGSIGVIMGYFVMQELFEDKLGIKPVFLKSGPKKGWPNTFSKPTPDQNDYLMEKIIDPSYERFIQVVNDGRPDLNLDEIRELADGSIYHVTEALGKKLIDKIGYFEDAVNKVLEMADLEKALVVEYQKPFSFSDIMSGAQDAVINLNESKLYDLHTPKALYLWTGR